MTISERDAILRERAAFERGANELFIQDEIPACHSSTAAIQRVEALAAKVYPLPTRPREVTWQGCTFRWTPRSGLEVRMSEKVWSSLDGRSIIDSRRVVIADLLVNPSEEVEE